MAIRFDAAADRLVRTANLPSIAGPWTMTFWVYFVSFPQQHNVLFSIGQGNGFNNPYIYFSYETTTPALYLEQNGAADNFAVTASTATWYRLAIVRGAVANRTDIYWNGSATNDPVLTTIFSGSFLRMEWGAAGGTSNDGPLDGRMAALKWWSAALSIAEIATEHRAFVPTRLANLEGWYPFVWPVVGDNVTDFSGLGRNLTTAGTLTAEDGPPIRWRRGRSKVWPLATAGIGVDQMMAARLFHSQPMLPRIRAVPSGIIPGNN